MKVTAVIEDLTALGTISTVVALDVLHGMGIPTAILPAMLLSTSSEGFGQPQKLVASNWLNQTVNHWQSIEHLHFIAALIGYLGSSTLLEQLTERISRTKTPFQHLLVDPVMGDDGRLYDGFAMDYPSKMLRLAKKATVLTPNWTELQLLAGKKLPSANPPTAQVVSRSINRLRQNGIRAAIVVTGIYRSNQIGSLVYPGVQNQDANEKEPLFFGAKPYQGHFYGTGDTFAALILGYLVSGLPLTRAVQVATSSIQIAVKETAQIPIADRIYGMKTRCLLKYLSTQQF